MSGSKNSSFKPSLWRTCRALANRRRIAILRIFHDGRERSVDEVRAAAKLSFGTASQYLRALNARGFLAVRRSGRRVLYHVEADASLADSSELLATLVDIFADGRRGDAAIFRALTAFTHPRRLVILRELSKRPLTCEGLRRETDISLRALWRHLTKLKDRGFVAEQGTRFRCASPRDRLSVTLMRLAVR